MGLLHDIQESIVKEDVDLGSVLLKLRLFASRLNSDCLEEWVRLESTGYPEPHIVPQYRIINVSYRASFQGPFGSGIRNAPIPQVLIEKFAGRKWVSYEIRESISAVDDLIKASVSRDSPIGIDASNLMMLLQGNVYPDLTCIEVRGAISGTALAEIRQAVRSRILDLTLEFERSIPSSANVEFGATPSLDKASTANANQITSQVIYGNVSNVTGGPGSSSPLQKPRSLNFFLTDRCSFSTLCA